MSLSSAPDRLGWHAPWKPGVVVGGLCAKKWFIENSRNHAQVVFDHIAQTGVHAVER